MEGRSLLLLLEGRFGIVGIALKLPEEYMRAIAVGLGAALLGCASVGDPSSWGTPDGADFDRDYYECLNDQENRVQWDQYGGGSTYDRGTTIRCMKAKGYVWKG